MDFTLLLVTCFIFSSVLSTVFLFKKKVYTNESKIYSILLYSNLFGILLEIGCIYLSKLFLDSFLYDAVMHTYFIYLLFFNTILSFYVFSLYTTDENKKKYNSLQTFSTIALIISIILVLILPVEKHIGYSTGTAVNYIYAYSSVIFAIVIIVMIVNRKNLKIKKTFPFLVLGMIMLILALIQQEHPEITISTAAQFLTVFIMYNTIENPDAYIVELEKKNAELAQSASEAKTAFLSGMSHELRTPLNAIVGLSEDIMAYKDQVPEEVREDSEDIVNASDTLLEIVGNILDINKIEGGKLELVEVDYNPKHEFESLVKIMRTKVSEKPIEFSVDIDENLPQALFGDRLRIKQVINNFLSNAIKYTDEGKINFSAKWISPIESLQIIVADTGHGIKQEDMGKLFEKFERLQVEKVSSVQGTGLGLSITKNLVELMGGQIHVESEYGKGSIFSVTIPQKLGDASKLEELDTEKQNRSQADYTGKKILVVDDNSLNIKVLKKALKPFNFEMDECYDGKTAVDKIKANHYDIVLMDIMMPGMGGEEALSILKKDPEFNTPIIALTADATTGAKEKYLSAGFSDYLAKPFNRDTIAQKLEKIIK